MESVSDREWTIGELARVAGVAPHVLRHWESVGLLRPNRNSAGRRLYGAQERERVAIIRLGKRAGLSLEEIGLVLGASDLGRRRSVLTRRRAELQDLIAAAQRSSDMLEHAITCTYPDITQCPHFRAALDLRST